MQINLEIGELQAFIAVAEQSSFKAAADGLFISQPALSRRIEKLESSLKVRLFERTTRRVSLTDAGRQFLVHAEAVINQLQQAVEGMSRSSEQRKEHVTVACVASVANQLLPDVLKDFAQRHPEVFVRVIDESAPEVLECVVSGTADFGINFIGGQEADIDFRTINTERYVLIVRNDHPLADRPAVTWSALAGERLVSVSQSSTNRMLIDHALSRVEIRPNIQYEINHTIGAIGLVAAGLGVAILPGLLNDQRAKRGLVSIPLTEPVITRTLGLITRKGSRLHPAAQALADLLEAALSVR
ncbi:MAG: LysR family transcriptional regulator [Rhodocyclales bacterium GT-UBC]|nr:MAG: LysR family transcriptional regulator [Rhodocyclales bacterium GT-UBC]